MSHPARLLIGNPSYRRVLSGAALVATSTWLEQLAVGWYVLDTTGSVFLTALAWSARTFPNLVFGPISGALADRYPRDRVLALNALVRSAILIAMALTVWLGEASGSSTGALLLLVALGGMSNTVNLAALQSLGADVAPPTHLGVSVSLLSLAQRAVAAVSVLVGGVVLARLGPLVVFVVAAVPLLFAAVAFVRVAAKPRAVVREPLFASAWQGFAGIMRVPAVLGLLVLMAVTEILGFSYTAFLPSIAADTLVTDASGLGALMSAAALGAMAGVGVLAWATPSRRGPVLVGVIAVFGVLVAVLPWSQALPLSLLIAAGIGACAASVDALQWTMLQAAVDESMRGRVLGAWNVAIGFGWLGPLMLGLLAEVTSVAVALATAGIVLVVMAGAATRTRLVR